MNVFIQITQLLLSLSILVIFHEFGHFIAAKIFKTRVEKFYLFFNPWFSLFKIKFKDTEYGMGWLPLGGYVKISGMIDESMDKEAMKLPPQPWEFRSKPAWQRLIIMIGGVTVNVLLAFAIYIMILAVWGDRYLANAEVSNKGGVVADSLAYDIGFRNGDQILSVDGKPVEEFWKILHDLVLEEASNIQVQRDGKIINLEIPEGTIGQLVTYKEPTFLMPRMPIWIIGFPEKSQALDAGLQSDDRIIELDSIPTKYFDEFTAALKTRKGQLVNVEVVRGTDTLNYRLPVSEEGTIGIQVENRFEKLFEYKWKEYSLLEAIPAGFLKTFDGIGNYLKQLKLLFSPEVKAYKSVGGFDSIRKIFEPVWNWEGFWRLTAFLSIMLAILNLLPIPALDGGHVMFLVYEIVTGRKPSDKFMEYAQITGMILLFALLIFANGNDIMKYFKK
jgi:regulator of sigma E protease